MTDNLVPLLMTIALVLLLYYLKPRFLARKAKKIQEHREKQQAFLQENKVREGVITTSSGLQYEIVEEGDGVNFPKPDSRVKVHYHGTLINGTEFDSSVTRKEPISFGVNQVIPGWAEALQLISVGTKARLYISADLGYGGRAIGKIPANSTLLFDVELLAIEEA